MTVLGLINCTVFSTLTIWSHLLWRTETVLQVPIEIMSEGAPATEEEYNRVSSMSPRLKKETFASRLGFGNILIDLIDSSTV